ncbi:hypothetical protein BGX34_008380 [Mortierella sp. NVP85]|nr:hypothetical protein BGX34_008380 [Mortierella sp. NVP85]
MVLTRSKANPNAAPAPKPAAPSKRKSNASASKAAKVAKTEDATDTASAKEAASASSDLNAPAPAPVADVVSSDTLATDSAVPALATIPAVDPVQVEETATEEVPPAPTAPAAATIPAPVQVPEVVIAAAEPVVVSTEEPTVHEGGSTSSSIQRYDAVVSDIEGTTTPIVFVKETLFPYVTSKLKDFLKRNWDSEEMKSAVEALRVQAAKDIADGITDATPIAVESTDVTAEKVQEDVIASVEWQMKVDRKIGALKAFQGYMWKEGYENGDLKGDIYDDVIPALDQWKAEGKKMYIYSSGSIEAQKLIFGYTAKGDLKHYFSGYFDTTTGPKVEAQSYTKIAEQIAVDPAKILFLSDNINEIVAAKKAGFQAVVTDRPGNAPLTEEERASNTVVSSFLEIPKPQ